jgi:hypothetical protein
MTSKKAGKGNSDMIKLKERVIYLEKENNEITKQKNSFDQLMNEYKERSEFIKDLYYYIKKFVPEITAKANYIEKYMMLPFLYNNSQEKLFDDTIDFAIFENCNCKKENKAASIKLSELFEKFHLLKLLKDEKNVITNFGNYKLNNQYKLGDWKTDNNDRGLAFTFVNMNKKLMNINVRILIRFESSDMILHESGCNISGKTIFDIMNNSVSVSEYLIDDDYFSTYQNEKVVVNY